MATSSITSADFSATRESCLGDCGYVGRRDEMHPGRDAWEKRVRKGYYCDACVPKCGWTTGAEVCTEPYWQDSLGGFCVAHEIDAALASYRDAQLHNDHREMLQAKRELLRAKEEVAGTQLEQKAKEALDEVFVTNSRNR